MHPIFSHWRKVSDLKKTRKKERKPQPCSRHTFGSHASEVHGLLSLHGHLQLNRSFPTRCKVKGHKTRGKEYGVPEKEMSMTLLRRISCAGGRGKVSHEGSALAGAKFPPRKERTTTRASIYCPPKKKVQTGGSRPLLCCTGWMGIRKGTVSPLFYFDL